MWYQQQSDDYRPLFWISGRAIYANTLLVILHITAFVTCGVVWSFLQGAPLVEMLGVDPVKVWHGQVWRLVSYIAFDPAFFSQRSLWFPISMLILFFCGREVEQLVGRKVYLTFYAALILIPAVLLCLTALLFPQVAYDQVGYPHVNCAEVIFGVFVAFATIYPGAMPSMWVNIPIWIVAWILLGLNTLLDMVAHDSAAIFMLWTSSAVGYLGMRLAGAGRGMTWLTDWVESKRSERLARKHDIRVLTEKKSTESLDAILEKISRTGMESLTSSERAALEKARTKLIDRDRR